MSKWLTPDIPVERRNLTGELDAINRAAVQYAPQYFALEQQYGPQYARLNLENLNTQMRGFDGTLGEIGLNRLATNEQRGADIADVQTLGPQAIEAYLNANPWLRASVNEMTARTQNSPILGQMNQDALAGLQSGG